MADWSAPFDASRIGHDTILVHLPTMAAARQFADTVPDLRWRGGESFPGYLPWGLNKDQTAVEIEPDGALRISSLDVWDRLHNAAVPRFTFYEGDTLPDFDVSGDINLF